MTLLGEVRFGTLNPLWWRVPLWAALTAASVAQTDGTLSRIVGGSLMVLGWVAMQLPRFETRWVRPSFIVVAAALGIGACFAMPSGLAEVVVAVAAARAPDAMDGVPLRIFVVVGAIALAVTVGFIARNVAGALAGVAIPFLVQRSVEHRDLVRERDRAQALLAEAQRGREAETQAAALTERGRIAREMHDVLAHSLAGLSVQLQAVRAVAAREHVGHDVLEPLDKAAILARDGLAEARAAVGALRDPAGLGLTELPALVERHPGDAALHVHGETGRIGAAAGHAIYRAVQESMTNAARYAPGSPVAVDLDWQPAALTVRITDSGPAPGRAAVGGQGSGLGLRGMAERISEQGGSLRAGPREPAGWAIVIEMPTENAAVTA